MRVSLKRWIFLLLAALIVAAALTGCGASQADAETGDGSLRVVAENFPCYDFARAVCGDRAEVEMLLPPGSESHSYEPTPGDILSIRDCALFFCVGGESGAWVDTILESVDTPVNTLKMVDCVDLLTEETTRGMTTRQEQAEGGVEMDEHVWTAPANAAVIVRAVGEKMAELDPAGATEYRTNAKNYIAQIDALDDDFRTFFNGVQQKVMVFGDRFPLRYFAAEYGLQCYAAFPGCSTQTEPSAATVAFLTREVEREHLTTVYYIEFSNHLVADGIAEAAGVKTAEFDCCHNVSKAQIESGATYVSIMRGDLKMLRSTMK